MMVRILISSCDSNRETLHLAGADLLGDLRLGALLEESQLNQSPFVVVELRQSLVDDQPRLRTVNVLVSLVGAEANPPAHRCIHRRGALAPTGEVCLLHRSDWLAQLLGEISHSWHGAHLVGMVEALAAQLHEPMVRIGATSASAAVAPESATNDPGVRGHRTRARKRLPELIEHPVATALLPLRYR
jgi:hypothetical protein